MVLSSNSLQQRPQCPFLIKCQGCHIQVHTVCLLFRIIPTAKASLPASRALASFWQARPQLQQWQPKAYVATALAHETPAWLLDSGASHHVTVDLNKLSLHSSYDGPNDVVISGGTEL